MDEILQDISKAVSAIERIDPVPILLAVLRETAGTRLAAVVRVPKKASTVCTVQDQLQHQFDREREHTALLDEHAASELREQFIAILGHDLRYSLQAVLASTGTLQRRLPDLELLNMPAASKPTQRGYLLCSTTFRTSHVSTRRRRHSHRADRRAEHQYGPDHGHSGALRMRSRGAKPFQHQGHSIGVICAGFSRLRPIYWPMRSRTDAPTCRGNRHKP